MVRRRSESIWLPWYGDLTSSPRQNWIGRAVSIYRVEFWVPSSSRSGVHLQKPRPIWWVLPCVCCPKRRINQAAAPVRKFARCVSVVVSLLPSSAPRKVAAAPSSPVPSPVHPRSRTVSRWARRRSPMLCSPFGQPGPRYLLELLRRGARHRTYVALLAVHRASLSNSQFWSSSLMTSSSCHTCIIAVFF
jgi:hypothetical protein